MPKFIIQGGCQLAGEIAVGGAKNMALKVIPAALLLSGPLEITNLPQIEDIDRLLELLTDIGAQVSRHNHSCTINIETIKLTHLPASLTNKLRASIMLVGPLLARGHEVTFSHPGGCVIGAGTRPIDFFLDGWLAMGAQLKQSDSGYSLAATDLHGCDYFFPNISVTGTESLLLTASLARGTTRLYNCAMEPEIVALAEFLNSCGAKIVGAGTPTIIIEGVEKLTGGHCEIIPDRIEAGTLAILAALTKSRLTISQCQPQHLTSLLSIFKKINVQFQVESDQIKIYPSDKIKAYSLKTHEYPGFPTDLQSPYTVMMTQARGSAIIHETIYDRRLLFTDMLAQMGANIIMCDPHRVVVNGPTPLVGHKLTSPDLRAGIAMVMAGLIADGKTEIDNIYQIDRGYERIDERLRKLGAEIERVD